MCYDRNMSQQQKLTLTLLRLALAWIFLYSSISKIAEGDWTSAGLLKGAQTFSQLFAWLASPQNMGWVDFMNVYGQLALGIALLLGVFLPLAAVGGILMMFLYYLAQLHFPFVGEGKISFLVDQHIIYSICLLLLWKFDAGKYYGLKKKAEKLLPSSIKKLN